MWGRIYYLPWKHECHCVHSFNVGSFSCGHSTIFPLLVLPSATREASSMTKTVPSLLWSWRQLYLLGCAQDSSIAWGRALRSCCCCLVGLIEVIRTKVTCRLVSWPSILCFGVTCRCWSHSLHHLTAVSTSTRLPSTRLSHHFGY